jgi:hypothetical protein
MFGPHPDQMPLLDLEALHPLHRFQHPVDVIGAWWKWTVDPFIGGK